VVKLRSPLLCAQSGEHSRPHTHTDKRPRLLKHALTHTPPHPPAEPAASDDETEDDDEDYSDEDEEEEEEGDQDDPLWFVMGGARGGAGRSQLFQGCRRLSEVVPRPVEGEQIVLDVRMRTAGAGPRHAVSVGGGWGWGV